MKMLLQLTKMLLSGILLAVWFVSTIALASLAIVTVFPAITIICFPEILLLWLVPALILLVFGGWIPEEKIWQSVEKIKPNDDNIN